jgi:hypothetical protein
MILILINLILFELSLILFIKITELEREVKELNEIIDYEI